MWFQAIKLAMSTGSKIYANRQKTKQAMSDAQLMHAERMAHRIVTGKPHFIYLLL